MPDFVFVAARAVFREFMRLGPAIGTQLSWVALAFEALHFLLMERTLPRSLHGGRHELGQNFLTTSTNTASLGFGDRSPAYALNTPTRSGIRWTRR
ncbi:hypothetical protein [Kribbella solani]|uniref:Uncharacterized protein n=1 Tax=Kribbella solani TaxID=236067 RepID=A0A841DE54_9ACTN|nr:hypothetical protein [Kribbella solani]MBB5977354.1 hypothetical protein [Kribbella solani]